MKEHERLERRTGTRQQSEIFRMNTMRGVYDCFRALLSDRLILILATKVLEYDEDRRVVVESV
jgi:hypothetical protein